MDFSHVKQIFAWKNVQPISKDQWDWSHTDAMMHEIKAKGIQVIARVDQPPEWAVTHSADTNQAPLDLAAWSAYCGALGSRYKGQIAGYQVWNEPNLAREWFGRPPDPGGYLKVLQACYAALKAVDSSAIVISAGLAPTGTRDLTAMPDDEYLLALYAQGFSGMHDVLGLNAPGYKSVPQTDPGDPALQGNRWQVFRHVEDMRAIQVSKGDGAKQIAILEMGWTLDPIHPEYAWFAVSEAQQASNLVDAYQYAAAHWRPWVGLMTTIYLPDPDWTEQQEQYWWAISTPGYTPRMRPAFIALSNMAKVSGNVSKAPRDPGKAGREFTPMAPSAP
jgi:hypothetical protein